MIIIGFVVAIMLFSSFAIVFSNSENTLTNVKNNNNLNVKSFTTSNNITIPNAKNDLNTPIEFYANFMLYVNTNNYFEIVNLSNNKNVTTNLTYDTTYTSDYYGLIIHNGYLYIYNEWANSGSSGASVSLYQYNLINLELVNSMFFNYEKNYHDGNREASFGIFANNNGIYDIFCTEYAAGVYALQIDEINYNGQKVTHCIDKSVSYPKNIDYSIYTMGNYLIMNFNSGNYAFQLNPMSVDALSGAENYGEMIYNNTYTNSLNVTNSDSLQNIYISNNVTYGNLYNFYKLTNVSEPKLYDNYRDNGYGDVSFINANFYKNSYVNFNGYLIYNSTYKVKLGTYNLPYTIFNKKIYYAINSTTYSFVSFISYKLNITSYNHNSNQIKDYFYYNDNIYSGLQVNLTNSNGIFSVLPLNYSTYSYNGSYITTNSKEFKSIGNGIYEYNLSIYYGQLTTNSTSSIKPLDISNYIYPIGIIIFVSFLGAMVYFSKSEGKK